MSTARNLLLVGFGGAIGSCARYALSFIELPNTDPNWPIGTFLVNIIGCFFMGLIVATGSIKYVPPVFKLTIATGVLGGFTTYSSFNAELLFFLQQKYYGHAAVYSIFTFVTCAISGAVGMWVAMQLFETPSHL